MILTAIIAISDSCINVLDGKQDQSKGQERNLHIEHHHRDETSNFVLKGDRNQSQCKGFWFWPLNSLSRFRGCQFLQKMMAKEKQSQKNHMVLAIFSSFWQAFHLNCTVSRNMKSQNYFQNLKSGHPISKEGWLQELVVIGRTVVDVRSFETK